MRPGVRLGVDVGTVRIGVARCDPQGMLGQLTTRPIRNRSIQLACILARQPGMSSPSRQLHSHPIPTQLHAWRQSGIRCDVAQIVRHVNEDCPLRLQLP